MNAAIAYYRCSDPRQDRSVGDQGKEVRERAQRDGCTLVREFAEEGRSAKGTKIKRRVEFARMRTYIESGAAQRDGVKTIYIWKLNRIGRNVQNVSSFVQSVTEHGMRLVSLTEELDPQSKSGRLLLNITASIDEFFVDSLAEDVDRGMRGAAMEGRWTCGRAPFGYRVAHDAPGRSGRLVVDPAEAEVIQTVLAQYERGDGAKSVAAILTSRGVVPPGRASFWTAKAVADIIANPVYAGRIFFGGELLCEAAHEAIIEPERWERLQALRRSRYRQKTRGNPNSMGERGLFLPWLRCGACGGGMNVQHGIPGRFHYGCRTRTRRKAACPGVTVRVDHLDPLLLGMIEERILPERQLRAAANRWRESLSGDGRQVVDARRTGLEARIADADAAIRRAVAMVTRGTVEEADVADELRMHRAARNAARDELALLPPPAPLPDLTVADLTAFRRRVLAASQAKPMAERRAAMGALLSSVTVAPGALTVKYRPRFPTVGQPEVASQGGPNGSW